MVRCINPTGEKGRIAHRTGSDMLKICPRREMVFEEGVDAYVPLVGSVAEVLKTTLYKLRSTMVNVGADGLSEFRERSILTLVSEQSVIEAGTSSVFQFSATRDIEESNWVVRANRTYNCSGSQRPPVRYNGVRIDSEYM